MKNARTLLIGLTGLFLFASNAAAQLPPPTIEVNRYRELNTTTHLINVDASALVAPSVSFQRLPLHPSVELTSVSVFGHFSALYRVDFTAPTPQGGNGEFRWRYSYMCSNSSNWGPSEGYSVGADKHFSLPASGQSHAIYQWDTHASESYYKGGALWSAVVNSCTGTGQVAFASFLKAKIESVTLNNLTLDSLQVSARSSLQFNMVATLHPSTNVQSYCTALAGSNGVPSILTAYGVPHAGKPAFVVRLQDAPASSTTMLVLASGQGNTPFGTFHACLSGTRLYSSPVLIPNALGKIDFQLYLQEIAPGTTVYAQAFLHEAGTGNTLSTQGLAIPVLP